MAEVEGADAKQGGEGRSGRKWGQEEGLGGSSLLEYYVSAVQTSAILPPLCLQFAGENTSGSLGGRYRPMLDGFRGSGVRTLMTHKYRGSIVVCSISKSVEPNKEQKEMTSGFQQGNVHKC